tara:strand:+ start:1240 stop:1365 length:126 start_codon:yes stop_codon:yes gene_type:complete
MKKLTKASLEDIEAIYMETLSNPSVLSMMGKTVAKHLKDYL